MKHFLIPSICALLLCSMSTAVISHWWSIQQISQFQDALPASPSQLPLRKKPATVNETPPLAMAPATPTAVEKEFYQKLLDEVKTLRHENLNMVDQMAETNRDLMKLEFRVDTHSSSFRPLKVAEENPQATFDEELGDTGVLPPRALPVPSSEE